MKKHLLNFLLLVAPMMLATLSAQKTLDRGTVKMEITDVSSDDAQTAQMLEMMKGTSTEIFFDGDESLTRTSMMGGMVKTDTKMNKESGKIDMYMDMMGTKMWIETDVEEAKKAQGEARMEVKADKSDTKEILGYKAYRVDVMNPTTPDMKISGYVTEDVKATADAIQGMQGVELPGFPLAITIKSPDMSMTIETTSISEEIDRSVFKVDADGYKKMTMEEFQKSMGGAGGMGF